MQQLKLDLRSILTVPMRVRQQVIGIVQVLDTQIDRFGATDLTLLESRTASAATAIENARLYERAQAEISDRVRAEQALREERASLARRIAERTDELSAANAELARAARLKDELLAAMSHELRTPLSAILGLSEALIERVYGPLTDRQERSLHSIEESGRHLLELINEILDVAKIEAGKMELQVGPVSAQSICQSSLRLVKQMAQQKHLKVSVALDSQVKMVEADARRLKQILINLLSNAVKFTPEGGEIGLEMLGDADLEVVRFVVWDTGIGIADKDIGRLFQPFIQLDSRLARRTRGLGWGWHWSTASPNCTGVVSRWRASSVWAAASLFLCRGKRPGNRISCP